MSGRYLVAILYQIWSAHGRIIDHARLCCQRLIPNTRRKLFKNNVTVSEMFRSLKLTKTLRIFEKR